MLSTNRPEDLLPTWEDAYNALPACYRADSCLKFYEALNRKLDVVLQADFDLGGTFLWTGEYWVQILTSKSIIK